MIHTDIVPGSAPALQTLTAHLSAELLAITGDNGTHHFTPSDGALWILATDEVGNAVGCGALVHVSAETAELKRMFSTRQHAGTGAALLSALEQLARARGYKAIRLSTRVVNTRAVAFYQRHGYQQTARYGVYKDKPVSVCLSKTL